MKLKVYLSLQDQVSSLPSDFNVNDYIGKMFNSVDIEEYDLLDIDQFESLNSEDFIVLIGKAAFQKAAKIISLNNAVDCTKFNGVDFIDKENNIHIFYIKDISTFYNDEEEKDKIFEKLITISENLKSVIKTNTKSLKVSDPLLNELSAKLDLKEVEFKSLARYKSFTLETDSMTIKVLNNKDFERLTEEDFNSKEAIYLTLKDLLLIVKVVALLKTDSEIKIE